MLVYGIGLAASPMVFRGAEYASPEAQVATVKAIRNLVASLFIYLFMRLTRLHFALFARIQG